MKATLNRYLVAPSPRCTWLAIQRLCLLCTLIFPLTGHAQFNTPERNIARSISGQFIVNGTGQASPLLNVPGVITNTAFIRLDRVQSDGHTDAAGIRTDLLLGAARGGRIGPC